MNYSIRKPLSREELFEQRNRYRRDEPNYWEMNARILPHPFAQASLNYANKLRRRG